MNGPYLTTIVDENTVIRLVAIEIPIDIHLKVHYRLNSILLLFFTVENKLESSPQQNVRFLKKKIRNIHTQ
jgi:hypothetical protein